MGIWSRNLGAVCTPEEVWQMTDELLVAQARWLPNYRPETIEAAKERLAQHERQGSRVALRITQGAARLKTRSTDELAQEREKTRKMAMTSDKGELTAPS